MALKKGGRKTKLSGVQYKFHGLSLGNKSACSLFLLKLDLNPKISKPVVLDWYFLWNIFDVV